MHLIVIITYPSQNEVQKIDNIILMRESNLQLFLRNFFWQKKRGNRFRTNTNQFPNDDANDLLIQNWAVFCTNCFNF